MIIVIENVNKETVWGSKKFRPRLCMLHCLEMNFIANCYGELSGTDARKGTLTLITLYELMLQLSGSRTVGLIDVTQ